MYMHHASRTCPACLVAGTLKRCGNDVKASSYPQAGRITLCRFNTAQTKLPKQLYSVNISSSQAEGCVASWPQELVAAKPTVTMPTTVRCASSHSYAQALFIIHNHTKGPTKQGVLLLQAWLQAVCPYQPRICELGWHVPDAPQDMCLTHPRSQRDGPILAALKNKASMRISTAALLSLKHASGTTVEASMLPCACPQPRQQVRAGRSPVDTLHPFSNLFLL